MVLGFPDRARADAFLREHLDSSDYYLIPNKLDAAQILADENIIPGYLAAAAR